VTVRVLGVDGCRSGWVGIVLSEAGQPAGKPGPTAGEACLAAHVAPDIATLVAIAEQAGPLSVVAVDIPIGLPDTGHRQADLLARAIIGPRRSSVFLTPARTALATPEYAVARRLARELTGRGISVQAFSLRTKILEVDQWVRRRTHHVVEVHPEVSFAQLAGAPLPAGKTTWAGIEHRRELLAGAGIVLAGDLGRAGAAAGVDDILDAAAAAWSARRVATGRAISHPSPPETFSDGLPAAIWA